MAPLDFSANLAFLFTEYKTYAERFQAAANAGFQGVEINFPYNESPEEVKAGAKLKVVLINTYPGEDGQLGFAAIPGKEKEFKDSLEKSFAYVDALSVPRLHIMSGVVDGSVNREECYRTLESNLRNALPELERRNLIAVLEPINNYSVPGYFLNNYQEALALIKKINSPYLRLQVDIFHLQLIQGNLTNFLREAIDFIGHVQVSQAPHRHEPGLSGEIDYSYIFKLLKEELQYKHWIGLEYKPKNGTLEGLSWAQEYICQV